MTDFDAILFHARNMDKTVLKVSINSTMQCRILQLINILIEIHAKIKGRDQGLGPIPA